MKALGYVLSLLVVVAAAIVGCLYVQKTWSSGSIEGSHALFNDQELDIYAIGRLRPAGGVLTIAAKPGERLESLSVVEGDRVGQGQPLGTLASSDLLKQRVELLQAQLSAAKRKQDAEREFAQARLAIASLGIKRAEATRDQELPIKKEQVKLLAANYAMQESRLVRLGAMHDENPEFVNQAELQQQVMLTEKVRVSFEDAKLALELAPAMADRAVAEAEANETLATTAVKSLQDDTALDELKAQINVAQQELKMSRLRSPTAGTVLRIFTNPGEFVTQQPILQMADLDDMVCVAEVYESAVKNLSVGQEVVITSPAFIDPYNFQPKEKDRGLQGEVLRIGKIVTEPGLKELSPLATGSKHVVQVVVKIINGDDDAYRLSSQLVDLQVRVRIKKNKDENPAGSSKPRTE